MPEVRKATVTQITTCYNQGMQKSISECTTHQTLKWIPTAALCATPVSWELQTEAAVTLGSPKVHSRRKMVHIYCNIWMAGSDSET